MREAAGSAAAPAARCKNLRRGSFIFEPPSRFTSLDHLVGAGEQHRRNFNAERFGSLEIDHQLELRGLDDRQVSWFGTFENAAHINANQPIRFGVTWPVTCQTTGDCELAPLV